MNTKVLIIVLIPLLLLCLLDMPYGYFMFVRWATMIILGYVGWKLYATEKTELAYLFFGIAILFNPIIKIALGRFLWNVVDVVLAVFLLFFIIRDKK